MKLKTAVLMLLPIAAMANGICPPVLNPDSQTVDPACPGLGDNVYAYPSSHYFFAFNDNWKTSPVNDYDYNDLEANVDCDANNACTVTWAGSTTAFATDSAYFGGTFLFSNLFHPAPVGIGTFATGTVLTFALATPEGNTFYTGPASGNPDGDIHAYVIGGSNVPEPGTMLLLGAGLLWVGIRRRIR